MAKTVNLIAMIMLLLALTLSSIAQDRQLPPKRRALSLPPQLMENPDTHTASGLAQSPAGYPISIFVDPIPRGSIIGLYGTLLKRNNIVKAIVANSAGERVVDVKITPQLIPKLEMMTFKMPEEMTGEVWVRTSGLRESNSVRFFIQ